MILLPALVFALSLDPPSYDTIGQMAEYYVGWDFSLPAQNRDAYTLMYDRIYYICNKDWDFSYKNWKMKFESQIEHLIDTPFSNPSYAKYDRRNWWYDLDEYFSEKLREAKWLLPEPSYDATPYAALTVSDLFREKSPSAPVAVEAPPPPLRPTDSVLLVQAESAPGGGCASMLLIALVCFVVSISLLWPKNEIKARGGGGAPRPVAKPGKIVVRLRSKAKASAEAV